MSTLINKGLARARAINRDRPARARELQKEGRKIFGYLCLFPVVEMLTALEIVPYRLFGEIDEPITRANKYIPTVVCPFLRSYLDLGLKGKASFLDGIVTAHICDVGSGIPAIWNYAVKTPYSYHLDTPHTLRESALEQQRKILDDFKLSLERYSGRQLTSARLEAAVALHNRQRALARELYEQKKLDPPRISGSETIELIKAIQSLPVEEGTRLLEEALEEVRQRPARAGGGKRLLIWGSVLDNTSLTGMIESLGAEIVMDDTCVGSRAFFGDVAVTSDPLDGLARHYLNDLKCPRTFLADYYAERKDYQADLRRRYAYLGDYAREWRVQGVILEALKYCDTHGYEIPALKDFLNGIGLPNLYLEHDYSRGALAQLKTRVQAFLEIIA
jgi:benzoyl-CoA reductase subunit C